MNHTRWVVRRKNFKSGGVFLRTDDEFAPAEKFWVLDPWRARHFTSRENAERVAMMTGTDGEMPEGVSIIEVALVKNASLFGD